MNSEVNEPGLSPQVLFEDPGQPGSAGHFLPNAESAACRVFVFSQSYNEMPSKEICQPYWTQRVRVSGHTCSMGADQGCWGIYSSRPWSFPSHSAYLILCF